MKKISLPWLALAALCFYVLVFILTVTHVLPPIRTSLELLENLHAKIGFIGFFIAALIEGIVYLGLYFPGTTFIVLGIILLTGGYIKIIFATLSVTVALTLATIINYYFGKRISRKKSRPLEHFEKKSPSKWFLFAFLHPDAMAFYFFNRGIRNHSPLQMILVPLVIFPYMLIVFTIIYSVKEYFRSLAEKPYLFFILILLWVIIEFALRNKGRWKNERKI